MTIRVKIEYIGTHGVIAKIEHVGTHGVVLIDNGDMVHVVLRPGESSEVTLYEWHSVRLEEVTDLKRNDLVWLTERATSVSGTRSNQ